MALCSKTQLSNTQKAITAWAFRGQIPPDDGLVSPCNEKAKALVFAIRSGAAAAVLYAVMAL